MLFTEISQFNKKTFLTVLKYLAFAHAIEKCQKESTPKTVLF